jgi:cation-transporting ATPase E
VVERVNVIGRVTPDQKRTIIAALQANGHVVAMTGDGVNDVPALKQADLGVAMASGSAATRTVAPVVLGDSSFSALPAVVAEGRRVIGTIEQVANLFVTKTVYASLLALAVGVGRVPFPFLPRHLTIISSLTIGLPAFFLALAPNRAASRPGFVRRVAAFAVPAGVIAAGVTFAAFAIAHVSVALPAARTVATASLFVIGLRVLSVLARPLTTLRRLLLVAMALTFVALLLVPPARSFFALEPPPLAVALEAAGVVALGLALVEMMAFDRIRRS